MKKVIVYMIYVAIFIILFTLTIFSFDNIKFYVFGKVDVINSINDIKKYDLEKGKIIKVRAEDVFGTNFGYYEYDESTENAEDGNLIASFLDFSIKDKSLIVYMDPKLAENRFYKEEIPKKDMYAYRYTKV